MGRWLSPHLQADRPMRTYRCRVHLLANVLRKVPEACVSWSHRLFPLRFLPVSWHCSRSPGSSPCPTPWPPLRSRISSLRLGHLPNDKTPPQNRHIVPLVTASFTNQEAHSLSFSFRWSSPKAPRRFADASSPTDRRRFTRRSRYCHFYARRVWRCGEDGLVICPDGCPRRPAPY